MQQTCLRAVWAGTAALIRVDQSSLPFVPPRPNRDQYVPRSWGWIVAENSRRLAQGKDDKSWFRGIDMPCRASRKTLVGRLRSMDRFTGDNFERRIQCQTIPSASGVPSGSAWLYLELSIIDWFETRRHYRFAIAIYTWRGGGLFLTNVRDDDAEICKIFH